MADTTVPIVRGFPIYAAMLPPCSALAYTANQVTRRYFHPLMVGEYKGLRMRLPDRMSGGGQIAWPVSRG